MLCCWVGFLGLVCLGFFFVRWCWDVLLWDNWSSDYYRRLRVEGSCIEKDVEIWNCWDGYRFNDIGIVIGFGMWSGFLVFGVGLGKLCFFEKIEKCLYYMFFRYFVFYFIWMKGYFKRLENGGCYRLVDVFWFC